MENVSSGSDGLKSLQDRLYKMLIELDDFCRSNNINYTICCGSALGAYRHQGFIPWDDDLDIAMDIKEYRRFCKLLAEKPTRNLRLQTHETDKLYLNRYAKVRDTNSIDYETGIKIEYKNRGCFIDVFPLEYSSPTLNSLYHIIHRPLFALCRIPLHKHFMLREIAHLYYKFCGGLVVLFRSLSKVLPACYSYSYGCNIYASRYPYKKEWFENVSFLRFNQKDFPVPGDIKSYLSVEYGSDYMTLPPEDKRLSYHTDKIDLF